MAPVLWFVGAIGSALIGLLLTILFQDRIATLLAKIPGGIRIGEGHRSITGNWFTYFVVIPDRTTSVTAAMPSGAVGVIRLTQVGSRVSGTNNLRSPDYVILGVFRDDCYLTGTWRDLSEGRYHWGGFQLWFLDNGLGMAGKFVGKDSRNHINHGIWLWARSEKGLYSLADWAASEGGYSFELVEFKKGLDAALRHGAQQSS